MTASVFSDASAAASAPLSGASASPAARRSATTAAESCWTHASAPMPGAPKNSPSAIGRGAPGPKYQTHRCSAAAPRPTLSAAPAPSFATRGLTSRDCARSTSTPTTNMAAAMPDAPRPHCSIMKGW